MLRVYNTIWESDLKTRLSPKKHEEPPICHYSMGETRGLLRGSIFAFRGVWEDVGGWIHLIKACELWTSVLLGGSGTLSKYLNKPYNPHSNASCPQCLPTYSVPLTLQVECLELPAPTSGRSVGCNVGQGSGYFFSEV